MTKGFEADFESFAVSGELKFFSCKLMFSGVSIPEVVTGTIFRGAFNVKKSKRGVAGGDGFFLGERTVEGDLKGVVCDFELGGSWEVLVLCNGGEADEFWSGWKVAGNSQSSDCLLYTSPSPRDRG